MVGQTFLSATFSGRDRSEPTGQSPARTFRCRLRGCLLAIFALFLFRCIDILPSHVQSCLNRWQMKCPQEPDEKQDDISVCGILF